MFLSKQNTIKWNLLFYAFCAVVMLILSGVFFYDVDLFVFLRRFDYKIWKYIGYIFDAKIWLIVFAILTILVYSYKTIKSRNEPTTQVRWFRLRAILKDFFVKVKTNNSFFVLIAVLVSSIVTFVLKFFIGRYRPIFFEEFGIVGFHPCIHEWAFNSMPSGHSAASFAGLVMIGMLVGGKIKWLTWTLAVVIGLSRIMIGAHWPSDVLLGAFIGMVSADFVLAYFRKK